MSITRMRNSFAQILKPALILIAFVFLISCFTYYGSYISGKQGEREEGGKVVASVNGMGISRAQYGTLFQVEYQRARDRAGMTALQEAAVKESILARLIGQTMLISTAEQRGIKVGWFELRRERGKMINDQFEQIRQASGGKRKRKLSDREFDLILSRLRPPQSIRSLRKDIETELSPDVARQQLMVRKLETQLSDSVVTIDDKRLTESYRQLKVRQILIRVDPTPEPQARHKAEGILKRIKAGADFATLAREFSEDPLSKSKGGDMGFVSPAFDKDLQGLKVGQTSGALRTSEGYRIVKVEDSKLELPKDFEKKKKQYRDQLRTALENQAKSEFYQKVQKAAKVQVFDPELKGYWLAGQAQQNPMMPPSERDRLLQQAVIALRKANRDDAAPATKLAEIYAMQGKRDQAIAVLADILDVRTITEGADLRLMLAQLYLEKGEKAKAKSNLQIATDAAYTDPDLNIHYQLMMTFKRMGESELAAKEEQRIKELSERMRALNPPGAPPTGPGSRPAPKP